MAQHGSYSREFDWGKAVPDEQYGLWAARMTQRPGPQRGHMSAYHTSLQALDKQLRQLEREMGMLNEPHEKPKEGLYQKIFGEGVWHNVDKYYGLTSKKEHALEWLKNLIPALGEERDYVTPNLDPEDRRWLERFLKEGKP